MLYSWLAVIPPLLVILVTIATRNVIASLLTGIMSACLLATNFHPIAAIMLAGKRICEETHVFGLVGSGSLDHIYTFSFLLLLGVLIQLMNHSGGIRAYTHFLLTFIKNKRSAQQTSLILSTTLFIDDYVNNLTVGAIMRPVTDHFYIARAKLALLLDSMSGPLCLIIPASSWVAFILAQMQASGITKNIHESAVIHEDALFVYIACIPYLLYPLLIIFSTWIIVSFNLSFGIMKKFEDSATNERNLYGGKNPLHTHNDISAESKGTILDFVIPIITFIMTFLGAIAYSGNSIIFGGSSSFMTMLQAADPFWALFIGSITAVAIALILSIYHNGLQYVLIKKAFFDGCMLMKNSLVVLLLAWTLSTLLKNDLHTGAYLASLMPTNLSIAYIPILLFIMCLIISASTGSVWGTIALMLPIVIPLYCSLAAQGSVFFLPQLYPLLGALFSGAVAGSHFSPITDAMIMTSFSAGCYHLDHVRTQMAYALFPLIGSLSGFLILGIVPVGMGYCSTIFLSLGTGILVTSSLLFIMHMLGKNNKTLV